MRILIAFFLLMPGVAHALSCAPPNAARSLDFALSHGAPLRVVAGRLDTNTGSDAALTGQELRRGGWEQGVDETIRIRRQCVASWCGERLSGSREGLFLLTIRPDGMAELVTGPCGGTVFDLPSAAQKRALLRCVQAGQCAPGDHGLFSGP